MKGNIQAAGLLLMACLMAMPSTAQIRVDRKKPKIELDMQRKFAGGCTFYSSANGQGASHRTLALTPASHPGIGSLPQGSVRVAHVDDLGEWSQRISSVRCDHGDDVSCVAALYSGRFRNPDRAPSPIIAGSQGLVNLEDKGWHERARSYRVWCSMRRFSKVMSPVLPGQRQGAMVL